MEHNKNMRRIHIPAKRKMRPAHPNTDGALAGVGLRGGLVAGQQKTVLSKPSR